MTTKTKRSKFIKDIAACVGLTPRELEQLKLSELQALWIDIDLPIVDIYFCTTLGEFDEEPIFSLEIGGSL